MSRSGSTGHLIDHHPAATIDRDWTALAVHRLEADSRRSADTHLVKLPLSGPIDLYLKDESTHPTGSLKHRLARSLFLYALCNGWIGPGTTVVEASSGSTAVSEAYFARLIGVPFVAVMSRATSPAKIVLIEREGGRCHLIDDPAAVSTSRPSWRASWMGTSSTSSPTPSGPRTGAATTTSRNRRWPRWPSNRTACRRGSSSAPGPEARPPRSAGTCGCAAPSPGCASWTPTAQPSSRRTRGRWRKGAASRIEGIGLPRVEPSFVPTVVDRMIGVPDGASVAAMRFLRHRLGISASPSTGTNVFGALRLACEMRADLAAY